MAGTHQIRNAGADTTLLRWPIRKQHDYAQRFFLFFSFVIFSVICDFTADVTGIGDRSVHEMSGL